MSQWYMLTLVGEDRPGIVAKVTQVLYDGGCNLGEASMLRLGGAFTIMLMTQHNGPAESLEKLVAPVAQAMSLRTHVDHIEGKLHSHMEPDVRIALYGADRAGIVAKVTGLLAHAGLNILQLESDVGGSENDPIYIMQIEGVAAKGIDALSEAVSQIENEGIDIRISPIDTLIG